MQLVLSQLLKPRMTAGMVHKLDQEYFKKVEAIEFAVKYDDGKIHLVLKRPT